jgi:hypothetical protein
VEACVRDLSVETIRELAEAAGLHLDDEQFDDLVASYRLYASVLARIPRDLPLSAEPSHIFDPRTAVATPPTDTDA